MAKKIAKDFSEVIGKTLLSKNSNGSVLVLHFQSDVSVILTYDDIYYGCSCPKPAKANTLIPEEQHSLGIITKEESVALIASRRERMKKEEEYKKMQRRLEYQRLKKEFGDEV